MQKGGSAGEGDFVTVIYNDQPPDLPVMFDNGHTKGVILANENGGIWLQHSVPKFPKIAAAANYSYPWTGAPNGQIFFCMTLTKEQLDSTVANILHVTKPNFYNYSFPKHLVKAYPNLYKLINKNRLSKRGKRTGNRIPMKDDSAVFSMKVDDSVDMTIFAKSPAHHAGEFTFSEQRCSDSVEHKNCKVLINIVFVQRSMQIGLHLRSSPA